VFLNSWFRACIYLTLSSGYEDIRKHNSLETLTICVRGVFAKSMSGWEIMEVLAGSVNESDAVLNVWESNYQASSIIYADAFGA
jgi:hypothetical protein